MADQHEIRGLLTETFEHFEAEPDKDVWAGISAQIHPQKKWWMGWAGYVTVAASIIILLGVFLLMTVTVKVEPNEELANTTEEIQSVPQTPDMEMDVNEVGEQPVVKVETPKEPEGEQPAEQQRLVPLKPQHTPQPLLTQQEKSRKAPLAKENIEQETPEESIESIAVNSLNVPVIKPMDVEISEPVIEPQSGETVVAMPTAPAVEVAENLPGARKKRGLGNVLAFANDGFNNLINSPIDIYKEEDENGSVSTYQLQLFNLKITRKSHRKLKKNKL